MFTLVVGDDPKNRVFDRIEVLIGSSHERTHVILPELDPLHARIVERAGRIYVIDIASTTGTFVNDRRVVRPVELFDDDRIRVGPHTLAFARGPSTELPRPPYFGRDPVERQLLRAIADRELGSRLVYADWLEERGDDARAEFLRAQDEVIGLTAEEPRFVELSGRLGELAKTIDAGWRVAVARPVVEGCGYTVQCPKNWGDLARTETYGVRHCDTCNANVHYCIDISQARRHAAADQCVAIDIASLRFQNDLAAPYRQRICAGCDLDVGNYVTDCPRCGAKVPRRIEMRMGRIAVR